MGTVVDGGRTIMKAAFVARAESLCTAANKKAEALAEPTSLASFGRFLATYIPIEEKLFADIKALAVPPGDETTVAEMLAAQDKVIANDKDTQAAAQKGNVALVDKHDDINTTLDHRGQRQVRRLRPAQVRDPGQLLGAGGAPQAGAPLSVPR